MRPPVHALAVLALAALLAGGERARADGEATRYDPVPPGIEALAVSERDQALASMAIGALDARPGARMEPELSRRLLVMLGDAGLRATARRLAAGDVPRSSLPHLVQVVASSAHPDADLLLERAAREDRPLLRMLAADGLGLGRTPRAVPALATLTRDPVPAVRVAALRSLCALSSPQAAAARSEAPADPDPERLTARLRWHRRCEDTGPSLRAIATESYAHGRTPALRLAAADLLALPRFETPQALLLDIVEEMGSNPLKARLMRWARGQPETGYDEGAMRSAAIDAALALLERPGLDAATRAMLIDRAVGWVAHPVTLDPYRDDPIPEHHLRRRLPDFGEEIRAPVLRRLATGAFAEPRAGVLLLRELGTTLALPLMRDLVRPAAATGPRSRAERERARYVRMAAAGALLELGRLGDEALARTLLADGEPQALKILVVRTLAQEEGAWVVPLLAELLDGPNRELRSYALDVLEQRPEPAANALLVEDLFRHVERPHDRMAALVHGGGEGAFAVLKRALADPRPAMRKAALSQFHRVRNPALCGREGRLLLRTFEPDLTSHQEIQGFVMALLSVEPLRAVRTVRELWTRFPTDSVRMTVLRQLQETHGKQARAEAIDHALAVAQADLPVQMRLSVGAVLRGHWDHRPQEVAAFWRAQLTAEDVALRWDAVRALGQPGAPDMSDLLVPLLERALARDALGDEARIEDEQEFARQVIEALPHQPWEKVEGVLIDAATQPLNEDGTRLLAARLLLGRLGTAGRARLMAWLDYTPSSVERDPQERGPGAVEGDNIQLVLAAAVGEGADPAQAAILQETLRRELFAFYSSARIARLATESIESVDAGAPVGRLAALARGIAHTRHVPTVGGMLDLVFDLRFAQYARIATHREGASVEQAGPDAAARLPSSLAALAHDSEGAYFGMPLAVWKVLSQVKVLEDAALARALARVLEAARSDGRLAHFPDLYLARVFKAFHDTETGAKQEAADVAWRAMRQLEPVDGALDYVTQAQRVTALSYEGRFREAAAAQAEVVRILARGNHGDRAPALWRMQRARLDALEGAALAKEGLLEQARSRFTQGVLRGPGDPDVLNTVAWERAMADFDLEQAEAEARRATTLEARVDSRPGLNAADTLAVVLLKRGKPHAAIDVLEPSLHDRFTVRDGRIHLHLGQMYAAAGRLDDAAAELVEALTWDRALEATLADDPHLAPLRESGRIAAIVADAAAERVEQGLQ